MNCIKKRTSTSHSSLSSFTSSQISSMMSEEVAGFRNEILSVRNESGLGHAQGIWHHPPELIEWIEARGEDVDNVYLIPVSEGKQSLSYRYKLVTSEEAGASEKYLTLSKRGINEFVKDHDVRFTGLADWEREFRQHQLLRQIRFYQQYKICKAFRTWRKLVRRHKFVQSTRELLEKSSILGNRRMRDCFQRVQTQLLSRLEVMGVTLLSDKTTKHINDFHAQQLEQISKFQDNFKEFRTLILKQVLDACKATLGEAGFSYDDYANEVAAYKVSCNDKRKKTSSSSSSSSISSIKEPQVKKLTFIEQAKKRQSCIKILNFVKLVDLKLRHALQQVIYNSIVAIQKAISERSRKDVKDESSVDNGSRNRSETRRSTNTKIPKGEEQEQIVPVFSLTVGVSNGQISYTPDMAVFESIFQGYASQLNDMFKDLSTPLASDKQFHPFSQPILYGKMENYKPNPDSIFFCGHKEHCHVLLNQLAHISGNAFAMCDAVMDPYRKTALEYFAKPQNEEEEEDVQAIETDVEVLKTTLANLQEQHNAIKGIKDSRTIAFFKVDLRLFKRTILPNINSAITKLQESLPKVGREKMEDFNTTATALKEQIEFEPKSTEDFVANINIVESLNDKFDSLEKKLVSIENVYGIMNEIPIPISTDDKNSLKSLKSNINSLGQKIQDRIRLQELAMPKFQKQLEREEKQLMDMVTDAYSDVSNKGLLEADTSIEEIKPMLKKIEKVLQQARAKVERYKQYEETYGFQETNYPELEAAERTLKALETLWNSYEKWDRMYDTWTTTNFEHLDVELVLEKTRQVEAKLKEVTEVLGHSPIGHELSEKVQLMLSYIPFLGSLKTNSLKERHWKRVSEVIGNDIKSHKITLGFLEQNNVFNHTTAVLKIIRCAEMEDELNTLVENLKKSWTEQRMDVESRQGIQMVKDFTHLVNITNTSLQTLKQLGSSQYNTEEMRAQLVEWFEITESSKDAIQVIKNVQEEFLRQDRFLTSMACDSEMPVSFALFKSLKQRIGTLFGKLAEAKSLLQVFQNNRGVIQGLKDMEVSLQETRQAIASLLHAMRSSCPWLYFLTDHELIEMNYRCLNNINAIVPYMRKMFPSCALLLTSEDNQSHSSSCCNVRNDYHPQIFGIVGDSGEELRFPHVTTARLDASYWIKSIELSMRHSLRQQCIDVFSEDDKLDLPMLERVWKDESLCYQVLMVCAHTIICRIQSENNATDIQALEEILKQIQAEGLKQYASSEQSQTQKQREIAKLHQLEYYLQLAREEEARPAVMYLYQANLQIVLVQANNISITYGYQYLGVKQCLSSLLLHKQGKLLSQFSNVADDLSLLVTDLQVHHDVLPDIAALYGKYLQPFENFTHVEISHFINGVVATGSWAVIGKLETRLQQEVQDILMRLNNLILSQQQRENGLTYTKHYGILKRKRGFKIILSAKEDSFFTRDHPLTTNYFRNFSLPCFDLEMLIKYKLLSRGVQDASLALDLVCSINELNSLLDQVTAQQRIHLLLIAIEKAQDSSKEEIYKAFLSLGAFPMLTPLQGDIIVRSHISPVLKSEFLKKVSHDAEVHADLEEPFSEAMLENSLKLQALLSHFNSVFITSLCPLGLGKVLATLQRQMKVSALELSNKQVAKGYWQLHQHVQNHQGRLYIILHDCVSGSNLDLAKALLSEFKEKVSILFIYPYLASSSPELGNHVEIEEDKPYSLRHIIKSSLPPATMGCSEALVRKISAFALMIGNKLTCPSEELVFPESLAMVMSVLMAPDCEGDMEILEAFLSALSLTLSNSRAKSLLASLTKDLVSLYDIPQDFSWKIRPFSKFLDKELKPQLSVSDGATDLFVPTSETSRTVHLISTMMVNKISSLVFGERGVGKSSCIDQAFSLVPDHSKITEIFLAQQDSSSFDYEDWVLEQSLKEPGAYLVVEGFDFACKAHLSYIMSILRGRTLFSREAEAFITLPVPTLILEARLDKEDEVPTSAMAQFKFKMVPVMVRKPFDDDALILTDSLNVFAKDFSEEIQVMMEDIKSFLIGWHKFMKSQFEADISDTNLYRVVFGLLLASPEEVSSSKDFNKHLLNEIEAEYAFCSSPNFKVDSLLQEFSPYYKSKFFQNTGESVSYFSSSEAGCRLQMKLLSDMTRSFQNEHSSQAKSHTNKLAFPPEVVIRMVHILRSYHRFEATILFGPPGYGKRESVLFCAHHLGVKLLECDDDLARVKHTLLSAYRYAIKENEVIVLIKLKGGKEELLSEALTVVERLLFYSDLDHFTKEERKSFKYEDRLSEYTAFCDHTLSRKLSHGIQEKIRDNLHVIVDINQPISFIRSNHSHLYSKSGLIHFKPWSIDILETIASDRLSGGDNNGDAATPQKVVRVLAAIHQQVSRQNTSIASSHYLDVLKIYSLLYKPRLKQLQQEQDGYQRGILAVSRSNGYIDTLSNEIAAKEPQVQNLAGEIEQLNKHLSHERLNLDKASKAFRRKEVSARKKSEETQELASDAHRNLEHALPSLDAAMQAINAIEKSEIMEIRQIKNPPELLQQVMEAVCILLGVKADWSTAKVVLAEPCLQQKLLDIDKDNISDQASKRIRRYIENPKFIPDEVAKMSKAACSMCMWVRAMDLYTKIFKSIEPKRIKLLQTESELAELMAALREETDRVAHIETKITSIQTDLHERSKKKAEIEASIRQTNKRLERARMLSYSLEEECKKWKGLLATVLALQEVLFSETILIACLIVYGCREPMDLRDQLMSGWKEICNLHAIKTSAASYPDPKGFMGKKVLNSWLAKYPQYNQNYLSILNSHKWPILIDPHNIAQLYLQSQNPSMLIVDYNDKQMLDLVKYAVLKGSEVFLKNFQPPFPAEVKDLFERRLTERVHAFVGLVGIPVMRKDLRVKVGGQEIVCHSKFFLHLQMSNHHFLQGSVAKHFNLVSYSYENEALFRQLLTSGMRCCHPANTAKYIQMQSNIDTLQRTEKDKKEAVLKVLLSSGDNMLDDQTLISGLKEAKAKVFEILNDLTQERKQLKALMDTSPRVNSNASRLHCLLDIMTHCKQLDSSFEFLPQYVLTYLESNSCEPDDLLATTFGYICGKFLMSLHPGLRDSFLFHAKLIATMPCERHEEILESFKAITGRTAAFGLDCLHNSELFTDFDPDALFLASRRDRMRLEVNLVQNVLRSSQGKGLILLNEAHELLHDIHGLEFVLNLARLEGAKAPRILNVTPDMSMSDINAAVAFCAKENRWIVICNAGKELSENILHINLKQISAQSRIFFLHHHHTRLCEKVRERFDIVSLVLPRDFHTSLAILKSLITPPKLMDNPLKVRAIHLAASIHVRLGAHLNNMPPVHKLEKFISNHHRLLVSSSDWSDDSTADHHQLLEAINDSYDLDLRPQDQVENKPLIKSFLEYSSESLH